MVVGRAWSLTSRWGALFCVAVAAASCGPAEQEDADAETRVAELPAERGATTEIGDDEQRFAQHIQQISRLPLDSLVYVMPVHLEEVGGILSQLEPMTLGMQSDTGWRSTVDSVQNDLASMQDMRAEELRQVMPDHIRRIERLILMRDSTMGTER
ncbi:MAG TPA: hypothetical protein VM198_14950 [Longimicrobiales bacterium]|nr:hypothetical protein [Longimicrobiales bacterium]